MIVRCVSTVAAVGLVLTLCASAAPGTNTRARSGGLLITASRLFDGHAFHAPGALLIRGSKIAAVDPAKPVQAARTIKLGNATILPGFIDLHVHIGYGMLKGGVTTVRNLGAPLDQLQPPFDADGLRILMAGPLMTVKGGYPEPVWGRSIALDVRSPSDARRAVRMLASRGASVIKIALDSNDGAWPMLSVAEVRAIVAQAHAVHLLVVAHALGVDGVRHALDGGVEELAHTPCGATPAMVSEIVKRHIPVVSTLHVEELVESGGCGGVAQQIVRLGDPLLYGTDEGNPGIPASIDVTELRLMKQAGMTPVQVLAAATSRAGADLHLAPLGTLKVGAPADVIGISGDARSLPASLARPNLVISGGVVRVRR